MQFRWRAPSIDFDALRQELGVTERFPDDAWAEAENAHDRFAGQRVDRTDLELVTVDPPGSKDLDQAVRLVPDGDGFLVHYAIADVAALVEPGGALDAETRRRGTTVYFPDGNVPLHPRIISEGAGSLLPDVDRPAVLWTVRVDGAGDVTETTVERAVVRSRARLDYQGVAADAVAGTMNPAISGLQAFGELREKWSLDRGAVQLELPDQEVVPNTNSKYRRRWTLQLAPRTPADGWNAQVSLLVGMCAGQIMRTAGTGFFRTLPAATKEAVDELRSVARHLQVPWPDGDSPGQFLATLPPDQPSTLALMTQGARLMRGAGYRALEPGEQVGDEELVHAGVGGLYAHVTAPLRRLGDRFATEICLAVTAGRPVDDWVSAALPELGKIMSGADSLSSTANRRSIDLAEATVLADQIGTRFDATVMRQAGAKRAGEIFIPVPAIIAPCSPSPDAGQTCVVEVTVADPKAGEVDFAAIGPDTPPAEAQAPVTS
ncbi:MAG: RNB domain-containing ribonuclease [Gordonia sp. (in: high G+C Gram-positive bacteria)]|uniref:RNB domain-containing ribonuclease n=1 Tax=Gordonia sp. (in: high G+C Gram-positive bacteria) TaxID=84139 RepID=UPI0039E53A4B